MSLGLEIFLKLLSYSLIIIAVRAVLGKIQAPKKEITSTESGEYLINHKIFSMIYLIGAIIFTIIFVFVTTLSSNLEGTAEAVVTGGFVLFILLLFLVSFLFGRAYLKIGKDGIYWRTMCGKGKEARYEDITSFTMDNMGNMKFYHDDECILSFATYAMGERRLSVMGVVKNHKIPVKKHERGTLKLKLHIMYIIIYLILGLSSTGLFLLCAYHGIFLGILLFFICGGGLLLLALFGITDSVIIENNTIFEKRMFRKRKIEFS